MKVASKEGSLEIHLEKMLTSLIAHSSTSSNIHLVSFGNMAKNGELTKILNILRRSRKIIKELISMGNYEEWIQLKHTGCSHRGGLRGDNHEVDCKIIITILVINDEVDC